ncbi:MAG TPA: alpha/beta fold hydrolase [Gemmatimonadaceae bacterium]|nr:alpha/beta fold hydrolase [Gemmatimonadaceae bacterium]
MNRRAFLETLTTAAVTGCGLRLPRPMNAASFHASRRFADTPFGDIAYVERGVGDVALFLHGFPLNGFQWRGALDRLSAYRRCIAPDFMGLGYTRVAPGQPVTPLAQVSMLAAFLDGLAIRRVDLVANDSGGAIAQLFVAQYPDRVRTLLLTNCDVASDSPPNRTFADGWLAPWLVDKPLARSPRGIGGQCYSDSAHPTDEAIDCYLRPLVSTPERTALAHAYALGLTPNPLIGLPRNDVPLRIVWGMADTLFSPADADYLDKTFPGSRGVHRVPGAKLFWPEEYPDILGVEAVHLWRRGV